MEVEEPYVAWQWKANGGTTLSNTDGTNYISTVYKLNNDAGFSIVTYAGATVIQVGHGLGVDL